MQAGCQNDTKATSCIGKQDVTLIHTQWQRKITSRSRASLLEESQFCPYFDWSLFRITQTLWNARFDGPCDRRCFRKRTRFVQFSIIHKHMTRDRVVNDYITKKWKELVPAQIPGWPQKSEVKERILLYSQLQTLSYLAGKNKRVEQDHKFRKRYRDESEGWYDR